MSRVFTVGAVGNQVQVRLVGLVVLADVWLASENARNPKLLTVDRDASRNRCRLRLAR